MNVKPSVRSGNRWYSFYDYVQTKREANKRAKELRKQGMNIILRKQKSGGSVVWLLYMCKKRS